MNDPMNDAAHDPADIARIVDALLAEHGLVDAPMDAPAPAPVRADRTEVPRRSWMDQVGRAKRAG